MKFGQLIEHNMRNIFFFFEKSYVSIIPRPFSKKSKLKLSLNQYSKVSYSLFLLYTRLRTIKIY